MSHPSVFEFHHFINRGEAGPDFEQHVNQCAVCAARLSSHAASAVMPAVARPMGPLDRRLHLATLALAACVAVLVSRNLAALPASSATPEGIHGVAWITPHEGPRIDAGSSLSDSGVR